MNRATAHSERAVLPDVARGLALLGILCVNVQDFAGYAEWLQRGADRAAQVGIDLLFNGKGISLFAMLFGAGALTLLTRGGPGLLLRRLLVLLGVGTLHYLLVWHGDIIANYAVVGLGLLLLQRASAWVLAWVGALLSGGWVLGLLFAAAHTPAGMMRGFSSVVEPQQGWLSLVSQRAQEFPQALGGVLAFDWAWLLGLFCLGAALQRSGLLWRPHEHQRRLRQLLLWGLGLGLPLSLALAYSNTLATFSAELWGLAARCASGVLTALGLLGALGLLSARGHLGPLGALGASGRLAMSNYLAQSIIMTSVFYPYGLNWYGRCGALAALGLALLLGLAQVWLSGVYLRHFNSGPAECAVRRLIYGRPTSPSPETPKQ